MLPSNKLPGFGRGFNLLPSNKLPGPGKSWSSSYKLCYSIVAGRIRNNKSEQSSYTSWCGYLGGLEVGVQARPLPIITSDFSN